MNYKNILKKYDLNKFNTKNAELFEILNKYELYKKTPGNWYLKPFYEAAYHITMFIAKKEARKALKK